MRLSHAVLRLICALYASQPGAWAQRDLELERFLGRQLSPVDQAKGHADLLRFRARLIAAAARHDLKYILSVADPDVEGCGWKGIDEFRTFVLEFDLSDGIRRALELGGVMTSPTLFRSNYVMMKFPRDADMTAYEVAVKPSTPVYEKPDAASVVSARLRYEIVIPIENGKQWEKIEYRPGKVGYVRVTDLESPTGYSLGLELQRGKWRIRWIASYCD